MKNPESSSRVSSLLIALSLVIFLSGCRAQVRASEAESKLDPAMERAVLETLQVSSQLYPPLWASEELLPEARKQLFRIAKWVVEDMAVPDAEMVDATISGSIANFNYSSFSDIDLHIFLNIDTVENPTMVEAYMGTYSSVWNRNHQIALLGLPVNIFVKNARGEEFSAGIYSVQHNKWIRKPKPMSLTVTREEVLAVALPMADTIRSALKKYDQNPAGIPCASFSDLRSDLRIFRKNSLEKDGELGVGNLAYKVLRRAGLVNQLEETFIRCVDRGYSIEGQYQPSAPASP